MNHYIQAAKTSIAAHKKEYIIGMGVILGVIVLVTMILVLFIQNSTPKIDYQPTNGCDLFTNSEAQALLGAKAINTTAKTPLITGDTAVSDCGYADGSPDTNSMIIAAIIVRSGINNKGVQKNKTEFDASKSGKNMEMVKDLGDSAYFNQTLGQLNVLDGRKWIILSYGVGSSPEANTVDQAVQVARKLIDTAAVTSKF
jgi:hypothetical protein